MADTNDDVVDPTTVDPTVEPVEPTEEPAVEETPAEPADEEIVEETPVVEEPAEVVEETPEATEEAPMETPVADATTEPVGDIEATPGEIDAQGRQTYNVKCSNCGKDTNVPFQPTAGRPVYCRDCLMKTRESRNG